MKKIRKEAVFLALIIMLALFLRIYDLGKESIWLDEGFALQAIDRNAIEVVKWTADFDPIPPFYYITLHFWSSIFGISESAIRFLSVLLSIGTLVILLLITNKLFNRKITLITGLLFAAEMLQVQYAQEARSFALFMFLAWLSTLLFVYFIKEKKHLVFYVIISALALYTLQLMVAVLLLHNAIFFIQNKKELIKKWIVGQIAVIILFIPWIGIFVKQFLLINELFQAGLIQRLKLPYFIGMLGIFWIILAFAMSFAVFLHFYNKKRKMLLKLVNNEALFILGVLAAILTYIIFLPKLLSSFIPARYSLFLLPAFYIYFAYGLDKIVKSKKMAAILLILVLALNSFALYSYYAKTTKPEWRETVEYINSNAQEGDAVVFDTGFSEIIYNYYGGKIEWYGLETRPFSFEKNREYIESIKPELKQGTGVWLVLYRNFVTKELYKESLGRDFRLVSEKEFKGIEIYYYKTSKSENGR